MKIAPLVAAVSKQNFRHAKVLIVEDDPHELTVICQYMSKQLAEVEVICINSQEQAVSYLSDHKLDEWKLPKMILLLVSSSSSEVRWHILDAIKSISTLVSQIPVVILSESDNESDVREAYERGASSYLVKPTSEADWSPYLRMMRAYWWETVSLPSSDYRY